MCISASDCNPHIELVSLIPTLSKTNAQTIFLGYVIFVRHQTYPTTSSALMFLAEMFSLLD